MAYEFRLPDIGEGLTEAEVVRWLVAVGDTVEVDEPVVEVETAKAVVEIPSPVGGVVLRLGAAEGEQIEVGRVLLVLGEPGEEWSPEPPPIVGSLPTEAETPGAPVRVSGPERSGAKALPAVRRTARELGVDLDSIAGSGPGGRITLEDVESAAGRGTVSAPRTERRRRLSPLRRAVAENLARAWSEIPQVTIFDEADASRLLEARHARDGRRLSFDALVAKAVMPALERYPDVSSRLEGDEIVGSPGIDLGVAVDTSEGLVVVVVRGADRLGLWEMSDEIERLADGARNRRLPPAELGGQSFTVSNIGAVGGGFGTPIVPPGTTAILSFGRVAEKPVVREGEIVAAPMMPLSLSFDHRVIEGAQARRFMAVVVENLSEPGSFLAD